MSPALAVLLLLLGLGVGAVIGFLWRRQRDTEIIIRAEAEAAALKRSAQEESARVLHAAAERRDELAEQTQRTLEADAERAHAALQADLQREKQSAEAELDRIHRDAERENARIDENKEQLKRDRERLEATEERLTRRGEQQDARALKLDDIETRLDERVAVLKTQEDELSAKRLELQEQLMKVAELTREEAREQIIGQLNQELEREKSLLVRSKLEKAESEAKRRSTNIIAQAIQRSASEISAAISVTVIPIPNDAMKGRIIGREGRNIRAFESLTGVDLIIDDTPEAVLLSSFNPIRREVAKIALTELITDGRIHPARIEESVQKAQQDMQTYIRERGDEAALESNVVGLKPGLLQLLGRMHFRTSYGQNVLKHSVQVAHLTGIIAAELGLDETMARRAGLLHDIGKSIDREIEGTHTEIGANLAKRFGEPAEVLDAIANHHELEHAATLFPIIVSAADAISAARPGARRESLESYLKRLENLETIATSFPGVEKSYAIQAGREIRIIVEPETIDDASAILLARDVANRIEQDMEYPGQVQVTVVRESRAVQYAR